MHDTTESGRNRGLMAIVAAASLGGAAAGRQAAPPSAQQPPQPTFRTGVTIVPVDVRVLDRNGKPVTDLKQSDFVVLEDGSPQDIRFFSARGLVPMPVPAETKPDGPHRVEFADPEAVLAHLPDRARARAAAVPVEGRGRGDPLRPQPPAAAGPGRGDGLQPRVGVHHESRGDAPGARAVQEPSRGDRSEVQPPDERPGRALRQPRSGRRAAAGDRRDLRGPRGADGPRRPTRADARAATGDYRRPPRGRQRGPGRHHRGAGADHRRHVRSVRGRNGRDAVRAVRLDQRPDAARPGQPLHGHRVPALTSKARSTSSSSPNRASTPRCRRTMRGSRRGRIMRGSSSTRSRRAASIGCRRRWKAGASCPRRSRRGSLRRRSRPPPPRTWRWAACRRSSRCPP